MEMILSNQLPEYPALVEGIRWVPDHGYILSPAQTVTALKDVLRYILVGLHGRLAPEFLEELRAHGRIYGYRFRPAGDLKARPTDEYRGNCVEGRASQVMINNNLCFDIALYPYELVTYGRARQVYQNWMQYRLIKQYLEMMTRGQTLIVESGHPLGLFHSRPDAPRIIITNSAMVGMFDNQHDWHEATQTGAANYGQMATGGWVYISPQGTVYDTFNTLLNAGQLKLGIPQGKDLSEYSFIPFGLGGMNGVQPKAAETADAVSIIAEVDRSRIGARYNRGWVGYVTTGLHIAFRMALSTAERYESCSVAYHDNVVDLLEYAAQEDTPIDLLSDQTFCHTVYEGGYRPTGATFEDRTRSLHESPETFRRSIGESLHRHFAVIKKLVSRSTCFLDYGNSFIKAIYDAGVKEISRNGVDEKDGFIWPSYVEDIMGPGLFGYGYGPFRQVYLSDKSEDLTKTDRTAMEHVDVKHRGQDLNNYNWVEDAGENQLVVGTQARALYQDAARCLKITLRFNEMVRNGEVGPIMLGRDHRDVSRTDSPFCETSNIKDSSNVMADMAVQCFVGNCARSMGLVALHNSGGTGIGKAVDGGFDMVCDGSSRVDEIFRPSMLWDVMGGVTRRSWVRNEHTVGTSEVFDLLHGDTYHTTIPYLMDEELMKGIITQK